MDDYVLVGKIINSFGIKGEVKIKSNFTFKNRIFKENIPLFIGREKKQEIVNTYRVHKNYDLITFKGYNNINEILKYKGADVYALRSSLNLQEDEYLLSDLIGFNVYDNDIPLGVVIDYMDEGSNILLKIKGTKDFFIPLNSPYIRKINSKDHLILTNKGKDLIL